MTPTDSEVTSAVARPVRTTRVAIREWVVEVIGGQDKGKKVRTRDSLVRVGTDPSNDLVLTDATVSRRHVEIERNQNGLLLKDLGSRNGSFLDGRQVLQAYLEHGDKVTLGMTRLQLRQEDEGTEIEILGAESFGEMAGISEKIRTVFTELRRLAQEDINLLLEGETGTGKELAARAVHEHSSRKTGPFRVVDCNLISEERAEEELFGPNGAFEQAAGGTIFLDEVGELPLSVQPKLLRVLETREFQKPGDAKPKRIDARIIASTNRNLDEEVRAGRTRSDLYFRLAAAKVRIPPLRTRREDIPILATHLVKSVGKPLELTPQALSLLESYEWPGNVRELRNVLERGALMQETGNSNWLEFLVNPPKTSQPSKSMSQVVAGMPYHEAKDRVVSDFERIYFTEVMKTANFDMQIAEGKTGLSMQSLYRLLKKNGLRLKDLKNAEGLEK